MDFLIPFLIDPFMGKPTWMWVMALAIVLALVVLDLAVFNRGDREIGFRRSLMLSLGYAGVACLFGTWVWMELGHGHGVDFFTGYLIEETLSFDNIFVMSVIFGYFGIPRQYQHRVLFWGIIGVIVLRGLMIGIGSVLVAQFSWILFLFAALLIYTGIKMMMMDSEEQPDIENSLAMRILRRILPVTSTLHGHSFLVREFDEASGRHRRVATPLLVALITIELADVMFAFDSVPAVLAITTDPYIVFTSNVFAILGLRSMYFVLAAMLHRFALLKYSLSIVLIFIGCKVFYVHFYGEIEPLVSFVFTLGVLAAGMLISLKRTPTLPES